MKHTRKELPQISLMKLSIKKRGFLFAFSHLNQSYFPSTMQDNGGRNSRVASYFSLLYQSSWNGSLLKEESLSYVNTVCIHKSTFEGT
jgi:hypothetical protein